MDPRSAANAYQSSSIENAPPIKVVRMLYQGAVRFLDQAAREDPSDPRSDFLHLVGRADAIISELRLALDHSVDESDMTANLERLYLYCEGELSLVCVERTAERLPAVREILVTLLDAWKSVELDSEAA